MKHKKAVDCRMIRPSNSNPGYFKYEVTIKRKDGSQETVPTYGKDMQDALSRLVWTERSEVIDRVASKLNASAFVYIWLLAMAIVAVVPNTPFWIAILFGSAALVTVSFVLFERYLNKDDE